MSELISHAQMAKRLGMSSNGLKKHAENGTIPVAEMRGKRRLYDPEVAEAAYLENVDESKTRKDRSISKTRSKGARKRALMKKNAPEAEFDEDSEEELGEDGQPANFNEAKTKEKVYQAALRETQYLREIGSLLDRDEVMGTTFNVARSLRDQLLTLKAQLAPFVSKEDLPAVHQMINDIIHDLQEAAKEVAR